MNDNSKNDRSTDSNQDSSTYDSSDYGSSNNNSIRNDFIGTNRYQNREHDSRDKSMDVRMEQKLPPRGSGFRTSDSNGNLHLNCTKWLHWIERNKGLLEECKYQPWFHALKFEWKKHQQKANVKIQESGQSELKDDSDIPFIEMQKSLWRQWASKQRDLMEVHSEKDWFRHLLENIEEEPHELDAEKVLGVDQFEGQPSCEQLYKKNN
ncbi:hypothetical protein PCYB_001700 [Plasmodium cynomolgi strain B]|uniref:Pvstp1 n=1 Tax=Plasmodium cynomolgi (strain B) TaxID=1120755 RepID=K6VJ52_PLACD|nr:hypothetical protein PCYB_001700 [Plasmodium cynomolgi strain B]GAB69422.1 hypothetical protein PCYB_001700 [Plasmodium cynomolgi strain B]